LFIEEALARAEASVNTQPPVESVIAAVGSVHDPTTSEIASGSKVRQVSEVPTAAALLQTWDECETYCRF
jgi:hypothetical protein